MKKTTKGINMKNKIAKTKETSHGSKFVELLGMLLIGFAIVDFASSWMGVNLTPFFGPLSQFSAMIIGFIGFTWLNLGKSD